MLCRGKIEEGMRQNLGGLQTSIWTNLKQQNQSWLPENEPGGRINIVFYTVAYFCSKARRLSK